MAPFTDHALDLFAPLGVPVAARPMFGGLGFYAGGLFFAIGDAAEGRLWLKVDDQSRAAFEAAGGRPFTYETPGKGVTSMAYLSPPDEALEDPEAMLPWARLGVEAARRALAAKAARAPARRPARAAAKPARAPAAKAARAAVQAPAKRPAAAAARQPGKRPARARPGRRPSGR